MAPGPVLSTELTTFVEGGCSLIVGTVADRARAARYCDAYFADIEATDGEPRDLLDQIVPAAYVACTVTVEAVFDQTPGPGAGACVGGDAP